MSPLCILDYLVNGVYDVDVACKGHCSGEGGAQRDLAYHLSYGNYSPGYFTKTKGPDMYIAITCPSPPLCHNEFYQSVYRWPASFVRLASFRQTGHQSRYE